MKKGRGYNEFCKLLGGFYSYENTYNEKTEEWHPHLHIFGVLEEWIDQESLSQTWHEITGDSMIVDIRRVRKHKQLGYGKAIAEVCKYALKFGDLSVEKTWEAYMVLKADRKVGLRLSGSFGLLRGVKMDDEATTDDDLQEDLPYLEMLYKFVFGKHSYYDLVMTRQVEPKETDRMRSEEEETTDRHDRMRMLFGDYERCEDGTERSCDARSRIRHVPTATRTKKSPLENPTCYPCSGSSTNPKMGRIFI